MKTAGETRRYTKLVSGGHGLGSAGWQEKSGLGERLNLLEGGVRRKLSKKETLRRDINDCEFGHDVVYDFDAGKGQRTFLQDLGFVVARGVFHGDEHALGSGNQVHCSAHAF